MFETFIRFIKNYKIYTIYKLFKIFKIYKIYNIYKIYKMQDLAELMCANLLCCCRPEEGGSSSGLHRVLCPLPALVTKLMTMKIMNDENADDGNHVERILVKSFTSSLSLATVSASAVKSARGDGPDILSHFVTMTR